MLTPLANGTRARLLADADDIDAGRRLTGGRSAGSSSTSGPDTSLASFRVPIYYNDLDCPYSRMAPLNKFDIIDQCFCGCDVLLWAVVQIWAIWKYKLLCHQLEKRVEKIDQRYDAATAAAAEQAAAKLTSKANSISPSKLTPLALANSRERTRVSRGGKGYRQSRFNSIFVRSPRGKSSAANGEAEDMAEKDVHVDVFSPVDREV